MSAAEHTRATIHAVGRGARRHGALVGHGAGHSAWQIAGIAATVAAGVAVTSGGVYAALTADAYNATGQAVTSGTLKLTMTQNGVGFTSPIADLAPGDTVYRYVTLQNGGSLAGQGLTLSVTDSTATLLTTDTSKALQVAIAECPVAWVPGTGVCTGGSTSVLSATSVPSLTAASPTSIAASAFAPTAVRYYRVATSLPTTIVETTLNGAPLTGSIQGLAANLTYRFSMTQRAGTTTGA
ncbi:TasA family protein [Kineococcus rubinsiae]|uniref:TasA family protein n=1 Tax=Kineococcus rubinsiae TaxID=2609562 RepID=UPI001430DF55|nr:TasA family protein [Kineococcus rubinsiae]NIZ90466.1 hypothetical protein [Kineococcus rubinsiae]